MAYAIAPFRVCGLTKQVGMVEIARRMENLRSPRDTRLLVIINTREPNIEVQDK